MERRGRKSAAQTPAPPKERIYGSTKNPKGSAASKTSASSIKLSESALKTLKDKKDKFNKEHPKNKVELPALKAVMRRGMGAYSKSHRPTITGGAPNSRQAWGFARVNKFLKKKSGEKVKAAYVQDDDLLEKGGEIKLIAPNGKKSNLTYEQYRLVRTPEFKAWFGDWENDPANASKVVDENGEPLVVYHGTYFNDNTKWINWFSKANGIYFSSKKNVAKVYGDYIKEVFLNIKNPISTSENCQQLQRADEILFLLLDSKNNNVINNYYKSNPSKIDNNNDGIIVFNTNEAQRESEEELDADYCSNVYVVIDLNQIKLADGTNTTFDANNPDIRYAKGGEMKDSIALPDTTSSYDRLKDILKNQGYELKKINMDLPVGKLAKGMTLSEVAAIHGLQADDLKAELKMGIETEMEHTDVPEYARAIALDHLYEDPKYYTKLKKMEKSYKDGGEIAHISGKAGGVLVGRRHSEGGIKAVNKSNNQPLEMEGGEVVITRNAVSDTTKREFEGEMLTNKEILSRINQSGGGVAFADGGEVESKCACKGNKYKWGGKMVSDYDIVNEINNLYQPAIKIAKKPFDMTGVRYADLKPSESLKKLFGYSTYAKGGMTTQKGDYVFLGSKYLPSLKGFVKMMKSVQSPFDGDNATYIPKRVHYDVRFFRNGGINDEEITKSEAYKTYLFDEHGIKFKDLPIKIQNALMIGNQELIDNYINQ